jgi:FkbM family methyltransferase
VFGPHVAQTLDRLRPEDLVLDVGGWACPFNRANWVMDAEPYKTRGSYARFGGAASQGGPEECFSASTWVRQDICGKRWPFDNRTFDVAICSHALEDVRDPLHAHAQLIRVAKAGYIEVPSRLIETCVGHERRNQAGLSHHRWLIKIDGAHITFLPKYHSIHSSRRFLVDLNLCERLLEHPDVRRPNGWIEQTLSALCAGARVEAKSLPTSFAAVLVEGHMLGKLWAVRTLWRMFRYLRNWREVWAAYRASRVLPALQFRRGFILNHGSADDPIVLLHGVFARSEYGALASEHSRYFVDIGANIGSVTLDFVFRDSRLKVDAYEPNPRTFETLTRNVRENGVVSRVRVFRQAVAAQDGAVVLWTGRSSVHSSIKAENIGGVSISVPVVSFDHAIRRTGATRVAVKIDVEGAEVEMLESASAATLAIVQEIALEYHDSIVPAARARCEAVLTRVGFVCRTMASSADQGILVGRRPRAARREGYDTEGGEPG